MTDQKSWLWRKKPTEKTILVPDKVDLISKENEDKINMLHAEKAELETELKDLRDKLSSALDECSANDELAKKHAKTAQDALAGWEKAEAKALSLRQELDEALKQRVTSEERTHHLDSALKECMQQLRFVREDQEQRIHDVLLKASQEVEETKMFFEEKLAESSKKLVKLTAEHSQLNKVLLLKEQLIEELNQHIAKVEGDVSALLERLEGVEKDNNSLIYEVRILEKEVDIRNEEREFNRRTADAAHKQHLENVKKIAKLESECQRLRVLVRKRLPGPAALAKMRSEVDMLQRDSAGNRRRKPNSNLGNMQLEYAEDNYPDSPRRKINTLMERMCTLEEENNSLRETLQRKTNELQITRNMYVQTAAKLSQLDAQLEELPKGQTIRDIRISSAISQEVSLASMSDVGSDDKASCAGSCSSALIGKDNVAASPSKSVGMSDFNYLMDDFVEMEKLALVCVDKPMETNLNAHLESTGKELVPIPSSADANVAVGDNNRQLTSKMSRAVSKLIEMIEGINMSSQDCDALQTPNGKNGSCLTQNNIENPTGYLVRVFQWKTSDLASVLQNFLHTCDDLLNGKADLEKFTQEITSALEWIINHCFSLQDVSSMKDAIRKECGWDETKSESENESGIYGIGKFIEPGKSPFLKKQLPSPMPAANDVNAEGGKLKDVDSAELDSEFQSSARECESLRNQLQISESTITNLQAELEALMESKAIIEDQLENHRLTIEDRNSQLSAVQSELEEAQQKVTTLEAELRNKVNHCEQLEAKCLEIQDQLERVTNMNNTENANQDEKQLRTEWEISAASQKLAECQDTILHLGKQLKALASSRDATVSDKFISTPTNSSTNHETTITTTTLTPTCEKKLTSQRSSLLDKMQAEDDAETDHLESPQTKEIICAKDLSSEPVKEFEKIAYEVAVGSLAIVPSKRQHTTSGGLLKKLLWRRKRSSSKKLSLPFAAEGHRVIT